MSACWRASELLRAGERRERCKSRANRADTVCAHKLVFAQTALVGPMPIVAAAGMPIVPAMAGGDLQHAVLGVSVGLIRCAGEASRSLIQAVSRSVESKQRGSAGRGWETQESERGSRMPSGRAGGLGRRDRERAREGRVGGEGVSAQRGIAVGPYLIDRWDCSSSRNLPRWSEIPRTRGSRGRECRGHSARGT